MSNRAGKLGSVWFYLLNPEKENGASDEIRTHDSLVGNERLYH